MGASGANKATQRSIRFRQSRESQESTRMSSVLSIVHCAHWVLHVSMSAVGLLSRNFSDHCRHFLFVLISPCVGARTSMQRSGQSVAGVRVAQHQFIVEFVKLKRCLIDDEICDVVFREQEILYHDDDLESFYSSFVALATHYICVGIGTCMYSILCICYCHAVILFVMSHTLVKAVSSNIMPVYRPMQWRDDIEAYLSTV